MYICDRCGHIEERLGYARIYGDNLLEGYMDEVDDTCPCCKRGQLLEAAICPICEKPFDNSELHGVCEVCLEKAETVENALKIGDVSRENVGINSFISSVLTEDRINHILENYVEQHYTDHCKEVVKFCEDDLGEFSDFVKENG